MPAGSPPYTLDNTPVIWSWLERTADAERRDRLLVWLRAVCHDPEMFATGQYLNVATGRSFFLADIPEAHTRVTYIVFKTPVRAVRILRIDDDDYELPS